MAFFCLKLSAHTKTAMAFAKQLCKTNVLKNIRYGVEKTNKHVFSTKTWSIFYGSHLVIQDCLLFVTPFFINISLYMSASEAGVSYKNTAVKFAKWMRQLFKYCVLHNILDEENPGVSWNHQNR